jgi:nicotinamidase-related amidase
MSDSRNQLLDVSTSVLLVIDLQGKLVEMIDRPRMVLTNTVRLLRLAGMFGVPVVLTEQYPKGLGSTHPDVRAAFDALTGWKSALAKTSFGCCGDDGFVATLAEARPGVAPERLQVVVAGIEAHVCVMQTTMELLRSGHAVHLAWDAISSRGAEYRSHALDRMAAAGAILTNHESVGFEWARDKEHGCFKAMSALFREGQVTS